MIGVSQIFFKFMDSFWGPHLLDRFADDHNAKLKTFNSKYWCPNSNTSQVDAFAVSWQGENNAGFRLTCRLPHCRYAA